MLSPRLELARKTLTCRGLALPAGPLSWPRYASPQAGTVNGRIDVSKTGAPIPKHVSLQFLESGRVTVNTVLNPSDSERSIKLTIKGANLAFAGDLYRMAPASIDATDQADKTPEVQLAEQPPGALPETITVRPFSVNIYFYPLE